jgi:hypothetical protein
MIRRVLALGFAALGLSGCALNASPGYEVRDATPTGITILADPALRSTDELQQVAQSHCTEYGKKAVEQSVGANTGGRVPVDFACQ